LPTVHSWMQSALKKMKQQVWLSPRLSKSMSPHPEAATGGRLVPITVRSPVKQITISGHATFGENGLVFLMLVLKSEPNVELEAAMAVKKERERQQIASYIHEYIAPELMSVVFSIESIRLQLEDQHLPAAAKLKELGDRLTRLIEPVFRAT
jgi:hypothetical protein